MVSNEAHQYTGLVQLLKHFGWIWIGLIVLRDESGDYFLQSLEPLFFQNGICSAFIQRIPSQGRLLSFPEISEFSSSIYKSFMDYKTKIFVVYGETLTIWLTVPCAQKINIQARSKINLVFLIVLLLLLSSVMGKEDLTKCLSVDPVPVPHEWYQPGDFTIGGIVSLTYGSFGSEGYKGNQGSFYHMVPNERHLYMGIIHLLKHLQWTWIGFFVLEGDSGESFLKALKPLLSQNDICSAFIERIPNQSLWLTFEDLHQLVWKISLHLQDMKTRA
ncbi:hypothetical protein E2320_003558 [Naja naja]|nr:hypothetical protein E2320_003558 [Naja naja]